MDKRVRPREITIDARGITIGGAEANNERMYEERDGVIRESHPNFFKIFDMVSLLLLSCHVNTNPEIKK